MDTEQLWEMAALPTKLTGLPLKIYLSGKEGSRHSARIKVSRLYGDKIKKGELFTLTLEKNPRIIGNPGSVRTYDIEMIKDFIVTNLDTLLDFWNEEITIFDLRDLLIFDK